MPEIYEILPAESAMTTAQILPMLKPQTMRGGANPEEPLKWATLHKKLVGRAEEGWYVVALDDGFFSRGRFLTLGHRKGVAPVA